MGISSVAFFTAALALILLCFEATSVDAAAPPGTTATHSSSSSASLASKAIRGTRSIGEVESLLQNRKNSLHKKMKFVHDLGPDYFDRYLKPNQFKNGRDRYWLVLFYSSWCTTCDDYLEPLKEVAGILHEREDGEEKVALRQKKLRRGQLSIAKHDVTKDEAVAQKYGIEGYPTLILFDRGDEKKRTVFSGERSVEGILSFLNSNMDPDVRLYSKSKSSSVDPQV